MAGQAALPGGYFARPFVLHCAAFAALAVMFAANMSVLGGRATLAMMAVVQAAAVALHAAAWASRRRLSFGARSVLVVLALLGPLYTLLVFSLYAFAVTDALPLRALPPLLALLCLLQMGLALRRP